MSDKQNNLTAFIARVTKKQTNKQLKCFYSKSDKKKKKKKP